MRTLVCTKPGELVYEQRNRPELMPNHAMIKIKRIGICGTDLHAFDGTQPYFNYPRVLGHELSGELIDVNDAPDFHIGEAVTFIPYYNCGQCIACRSGKTNCCEKMQVYGVHIDGGMVEYLQVPSRLLVKSQGLGLDELALVEPLSIGAHAIKRANVMAGEFVLVIGAGVIGLGIMQFACIAGGKVIAMDVNEHRLFFCKENLHVPYTINADVEDVIERLKKITQNDMPTVVIDATGNQKAINGAFKYMAHGARYILVGLQKGEINFSHPEFHKREATLMSSRNATASDFDDVISSMVNKSIDPTTFITHRATFGQTKSQFNSWLDPSTKVIKAMIEV